jgi:hypothetical protein
METEVLVNSELIPVEKINVPELFTNRSKAAAEKIARNKAHQQKINREALSAFENNGVDTETEKTVISLIAKELIDHIKIMY